MLAARAKQIVDMFQPEGWRMVKHPKLLDRNNVEGEAHPKSKTIYIRQLKTHADLFIFLHECGHVDLGHFEQDLPKHVEEYEAEMYAITAFRGTGLLLPAGVLQDAKDRVQAHIEADEARCIFISPTIRKWAST
jgi:hypothetical protein